MNINKSIDKLESINNRLDVINNINLYSITSEEIRITNVSLQYDLFMEFIGEYEDLVSYLNNIVITDDNKLDIYRFKKQLEKYWRYNVY